MRARQRFSIALIAVVLVGTAGCGDRVFRVSGKVTFDGKPLPLGRIYFDPDATKQNIGPSGYTEIVDGEYDTSRKGKGISGGPTVVRIQGFRKEGADASGFGPPLFQEISVQVDLPRENSTKDFDIPVDAAKGAPRILVPLDHGPIPTRGGT